MIMVNKTHTDKTVYKTLQMKGIYEPYLYTSVKELSVVYVKAGSFYNAFPAGAQARPIAKGDVWGGDFDYGWFAAGFTVEESLSGRKLFLSLQNDSVESFVRVNGKAAGMLDYFPEAAAPESRQHRFLRITDGAAAGERFEITAESYAGHRCEGTQPFEAAATYPADRIMGPRRFGGMFVSVRDEAVYDFLVALRLADSLYWQSDENGYLRAEISVAFESVFAKVSRCPELTGVDASALREGAAILRACLDIGYRDGRSFVGLLGHSHLDTAWLWRREETLRKAADTISNALCVAERHPNYKFMMSSAIYAEWMQEYYPDLYVRMREMIAKGQFEFNGSVYVECDCNIIGGEALIRQFLIGHRIYRELGVTCDAFWLPDTFGYSPSIPQIMKGCGVRYFLTSKLSWNDTNEFPYDSFVWKGIDGSEVLTHFITIHQWADPGTIIKNSRNCVKRKNMTDATLMTYGFGDGGGGPSDEMADAACACEEARGLPENRHVTVSQFMRRLEAESRAFPKYSGELYLEGHRGTYTAQHDIKRNNRKMEIVLRALDMISALYSADNAAERDRLWKLLLENQFHDILPGTSIPEVHRRAVGEVSAAVAEAESALERAFAPFAEDRGECVSFFNPHGFEYGAPISMAFGGRYPATEADEYTDLAGNRRLLFRCNLPQLSSRTLPWSDRPIRSGQNAFRYEGGNLRTPYYRVQFNANGEIVSLIDLQSGKEAAGKGGMNVFLSAEDVPAAWDNWDIDADYVLKLHSCAKLLSSEVICNGLHFRIRDAYSLGGTSVLRQDIVFYAFDRRIDFETALEWREKRRLLKVGFDTNILATFARHDTQFGFVERQTEANTTYEQAKFEVCQHKWTDISETKFGVALLNDCKYGIGVRGSRMTLTLVKCGVHPDPRGEIGTKYFTYALLPHDGGFGFEQVIRPAYELNMPPLQVNGRLPERNLLSGAFGSVVIEAVKPAEDGRGIIVRMYESEKSTAAVTLHTQLQILECDLLEKDVRPISGNRIMFKPFEIKTLRLDQKI